MPLRLRPATGADASALTDILHSAKASWGYPDDKMAEFRKHWLITEEIIDNQYVTIAERNGSPVAFSGLAAQDKDTLLVDYLFVAPQAQRQGIGDLLLTRAHDRARTLGLSRLYLEADTHSEAFYARQGFATIAKRPSEMSPSRTIPMMEKHLQSPVHAVRGVDLSLSPDNWAFEQANEAAIAEHFEEAKKRIGLLWNGRTLKLTDYSFEDGVFKGSCTECSYSAFLAWRDWGAPDPSAYNVFGSAILRSADGALLFGVMAAHTATAGAIYPPGGNLDPTDLSPEGKVDVVGAIYRELEEETGLNGKDVTAGDVLIAFDGPRISIARIFDLDQPAEELRRSILRFSGCTEERELADIRIVRKRADLNDPAIVSFARALAEHLLPD